MAEDERKGTSSYKLYCSIKCFQKPSSPEQKHGNLSKAEPKNPGGWRAMPFILGNETFERLATFGLLANFMVYLMRIYHLEQVSAANILNIWSGFTNFAPLLGAFISDAYVGRFKTIAFASCAAFLGMVTVTLTAWLPYLHPKTCEHAGEQQSYGRCESATSMQLAVLLTGLGLLSIGTGGIRPCSIPFGVDQFDPTTEEGIKGISSFYNWYYTSFTVVILIALTLVVYIQDSVSWVLGFGLPTVLMLCSIILFFVGTRIYVHVKPEGSVFSGIGQVAVSAYKKRKLKLPDDCEGEQVHGIFYDPDPIKDQLSILSKLPLTNQFRFLNKAAMIEKDVVLKPDGSCAKQGRLCSIQQVEEVKCLIKIVPIWASGIVSCTSMVQQGTFTVSQAMKMDRHLGEKFKIPASSIITISLITIGLWLPFYDRILVPALRKVTKHEGGITLLQRIGIGNVFSVLSMVVAGLVERERRAAAILHPEASMSVFWLAPQLVVMGLCEAFVSIGQIEFYNKEFPDRMRSLGNSLFFCSFACASYLSTMVTSIVHKVTGTRHHPDWLTNDLNAGKLDYFYFLLAGMGLVNLFYFLFCALRYRYKASTVQMEGNKIPL